MEETVEQKIAKYLKDNKITLTTVIKKTELNYTKIYNSLYHPKKDRKLRSDELIAICKFMGKEFTDLGNE